MTRPNIDVAKLDDKNLRICIDYELASAHLAYVYSRVFDPELLIALCKERNRRQLKELTTP